ncbi:hypothetical protein GFS31_02950 [Leptolyngbya sp. BL0902]|nr:hypothetical protein GFS31_02950 [Leptolyngbya sp. BL0902]
MVLVVFEYGVFSYQDSLNPHPQPLSQGGEGSKKSFIYQMIAGFLG